MKRKILVIILAVVGLIFILFPFISNYLNKISQVNIITKYKKEVENLTHEKKEKMLIEATDYNTNLENESNIDISLENIEDEVTSPNYSNLLNLGEVMGYISIPKIDVNLPIYHGISKNVLKKAVGHMEISSLPIGGKGTHCVLAGHTGLAKEEFFDNIDELEIGDIFYINSLGNTLVYKVDNKNIVEPSDTDTIKIVPEKDYVTLVTCTPKYVNSHRLLVRGERVLEEKSGEDVKSVNNTIDQKNNIDILKNYLLNVIIVIIGTIAVLIVVLLKMKKKNNNN